MEMWEKAAEISHSISTTAYTSTEPFISFPCPAVLCPTKTKDPSKYHKRFQVPSHLVSLALDKQDTGEDASSFPVHALFHALYN